MPESIQHKLDRVRKPRVQITYDVETNGAMVKKELPFVVGILADLSAHGEKKLKALKDRDFVEIDRDNINEVMAKAAPELNLRVTNTLGADGTELPVGLKFKNMDDFGPAQVAAQVPPLQKLLEMRRNLDEVLGKMESSTKLEELLADVMGNTEKVQALAKQMGITPQSEGK